MINPGYLLHSREMSSDSTVILTCTALKLYESLLTGAELVNESKLCIDTSKLTPLHWYDNGFLFSFTISNTVTASPVMEGSCSMADNSLGYECALRQKSRALRKSA